MRIKTSTLVKSGILGSIGYILMFISTPIPMLFPEFLRIDISDITGVIAGLTLGPLAGVMVELVKNLLQYLTGMSTTNGIGEFANFLIGSSLVIVASCIYKSRNNLKDAILALICGVIAMTVVGSITNYFIILPFYSTIMPIEAIIEMGSIINPRIVDTTSFIIWIIAPFNLIKGSVIALITLIILKKIEKILKKN